MQLRKSLLHMRLGVALWLGVFALMVGSAFAAPPNQGTNMGPEDQNKQISITVWLNLHNKATLDAMVQDIYDQDSANYHHFLTMEEYKKQFAPTAEDVATVRNFLAAHNIKVTMTDKLNHFVMAQGRVADAQVAFNVQINRVMLDGVMHRMSASEASVAGPAGALVSTVQGLSDLGYRTNVIQARNLETGTAYAGVSLSAVGADGLFFSGQCLYPPELVNFNTGGGFPKASYFGNRYGAAVSNTSEGTLPPCGYDAAEVQTAYGLNELYNRGLNGTGQTIMIVDAFGSNSILADANLFSSLNGLPELTPSNFTIFTPNGSATCSPAPTGPCQAGNWNSETTLDVEWAHSIAPNANIALVLTADNSFTNLDIGNLFAVENGFGNVLSNSFGISEVALAELDPSELVVENGISEIAAALGISQNVSTGDSGDNLALDNAEFGINSVSAGANADSPFATGVGGTSTFLNSQNDIILQTGWGLNATGIANSIPIIPPASLGFIFGAGGGASVVYAKPKFQERLPGKFRQTPDISMNADPQTGVEIIISPDGTPADGTFVEVVGGTSLSCPTFSAFWAIANQAAGGGPIGQAAPTLYELSDGAITDVNVGPFSTLFDVTGSIFNPPSTPFTFESAAALAQPLENTKFFVSAFFQLSPTAWDVITFGTDSSLTTGPGWDNVTGLGTPNGVTFVDQVVKAVK